MFDVPEESWECIWPPQLTSDEVLFEKVMKIISESMIYHLTAWQALNATKGLGIHPELTLVEELRELSGGISGPFIDEALKFFSDSHLLGTCQFDTELRDVLLAQPTCEQENEDEQLRDTQSLQLFQGCVWELCIMFSVCLLNCVEQNTDRLPSSCYEQSDRSRYILAIT